MWGLTHLFLIVSLCVGLMYAQQAIEEIIEKPEHKDSTRLPIVAEGENKITIITDDEQDGGAGSDLGGLDLQSLIQMTGVDLDALQNVDSQELNRILNTAIDAVKKELNKPDSAGISTDVTSDNTGKRTTDQGSTDTVSESSNVPAGLQAVAANEDPLKIIQDAVDNVNSNQLANTANAFELNDIQSSTTGSEDTSKAFRSGVGTAVQPDIAPIDNDVDNIAQREFLRQLIDEDDGVAAKSDNDGSFVLPLPDGTFSGGNEFTNTQVTAPSAEAELRRLQRERQELLRRLADVQMNFADRNRADTDLVRENADDITPDEFGNVNFRPNPDTFFQRQPRTFQPGVGNSLLVGPEIVTDTESTFDRKRFDPAAEIGSLNTPDRIRQLFVDDDKNDDDVDDVASALQSDSNLILNTDTSHKPPQTPSVAASSAVVPALPPPLEIVQPVSDTSVASSFDSDINRIIKDTERRFQSSIIQDESLPVHLPARTTDEESMISFSTDQGSNNLPLILEQERKRKQELERQLRAFTRPRDDDSNTIFPQHSNSLSNEHLRGSFSTDDTIFSEGDLSRLRNVDGILGQNEVGTLLPESAFSPRREADRIFDDFNFDGVDDAVLFGRGRRLIRRNNRLNDRIRRHRTRNIHFFSSLENDDFPFTGPVNRAFRRPVSFNPRIGLRRLRNRFNTGFPRRIRQDRRVFRRSFRPRTVLGYPIVRRLF